jgi:hypothetical protein
MPEDIGIDLPDGDFAEALGWMSRKIGNADIPEDMEREYLFKAEQRMASADDDMKAKRWAMVVENVSGAFELIHKAYLLHFQVIDRCHAWTHSTPEMILEQIKDPGVQAIAKMNDIPRDTAGFEHLVEKGNKTIKDMPKDEMAFYLNTIEQKIPEIEKACFDSLVSIKEMGFYGKKEPTEEAMWIMAKTISGYLTAFWLSTLTFKHINPSRFPQKTEKPADLKAGPKPSDYTEGVPIVDEMPRILRMAKECSRALLSDLDNYSRKK